jgi:transcriptional regulator with XRE-family HTH domain
MSTALAERILLMPFTIADAMPRKKYGETSFGERLQAIRKARGLTQVQLAEAAETTQRAVSYYETEAGFPPAPAVIALARALKITTDELLGVKPPKIERVKEDPEARRQWKRFQRISTLPERDQKAVARLINSLVAVGAARRNGPVGERNGR